MTEENLFELVDLFKLVDDITDSTEHTSTNRTLKELLQILLDDFRNNWHWVRSIQVYSKGSKSKNHYSTGLCDVIYSLYISDIINSTERYILKSFINLYLNKFKHKVYINDNGYKFLFTPSNKEARIKWLESKINILN